jgi:hypothetical protein
LDAGADLSIVKRSSLQPEIKYSFKKYEHKRNFQHNHENKRDHKTESIHRLTCNYTHTFHVVGKEFGIQYDGILGPNLLEDKQSTINYCDQQVIMGHVIVKFDPKPDEDNSENCKLTLKARSENIVKLPTKSLGHGLISKKELMPGVYLAESLTKVMNGKCVTSIVNTLEEDITLDPPEVLLEEIDDSERAITLIHRAVSVEVAGRLSKLREQLRTDHLNDEERVLLVKICEEYHDIFHL